MLIQDQSVPPCILASKLQIKKLSSLLGKMVVTGVGDGAKRKLNRKANVLNGLNLEAVGPYITEYRETLRIHGHQKRFGLIAKLVVIEPLNPK